WRSLALRAPAALATRASGASDTPISHQTSAATSGNAMATGAMLRSAATAARRWRTASGWATCTTRSGVAAPKTRQSWPFK
ncbi:hypothetical protein NL490_27985, partial [Klebsiella pneumoniae]|nr:hypothetical protein [Klebsiella pneumoniae]